MKFRIPNLQLSIEEVDPRLQILYNEITEKRITKEELLLKYIKSDELRDLEITKLLIEKLKIDLDKPIEDDWTPLHVAAYKGNLKVVYYLLENGANISIQDTRKRTPLYIAFYNEKFNIVKFLFKRGADPYTEIFDYDKDKLKYFFTSI